MPDREKIIKAIDICLGHGKCDDCGYRIKGGYSTMDCRKLVMRDVLILLKEQEPMAPVYDQLLTQVIPRCGRCSYWLDKTTDKYCYNCGQAVKWE